MFNYVIRRLFLMIPTFIGITIMVFFINQFVPGGPMDRLVMELRGAQAEGVESGGSSSNGPNGQFTEEALARYKRFYNLDKPIIQRYLMWLGVWPRQNEYRERSYKDPFRLNLKTIRHNNEFFELQKWIKIEKKESTFTVYESPIGADFAFDKYKELPTHSKIDTWTEASRWSVSPLKGDTVEVYRVEFDGILTGNLGHSTEWDEPVIDLLLDRMHISIYFGLIGFILSYFISIPLGIIKAVKHTSTFDMSSSVLIFIGYSIPGYLLGVMMLVYFGGGSFWDWIPLGGFRSANFEELSFIGKILDQLHHTLPPIICYSIGSFATLTVLMKNSLMENIGQDYVRTAFAKGLDEKRVVLVHALRNSLIPLATGIGGLIGIFFAGSYLIEKTFNINGIGYLAFMALLKRDFMVIMGFLVIGTVIKLVGQLISDIALAVVDPRIRFK